MIIVCKFKKFILKLLNYISIIIFNIRKKIVNRYDLDNIKVFNINNKEIINTNQIINIISNLNNYNDYYIMKIIYLKNNKILFEEVLDIIKKEDFYKLKRNNYNKLKKYIKRIELLISERVYFLGIDNFYIICNKYFDKNIISKEDIYIANNLLKNIKGFKAYIALNNNKYRLIINDNGNLNIDKINNILDYNEKDINKKIINNTLLNIKVVIIYDIINLFYSINTTKKYVLLFMFNNNKVKYIQEIPRYLFYKYNKEELKIIFEKYKKFFKINKILIITDSKNIFNKNKVLVKNNIISGCLGYSKIDNNIIFYDKYKINSEEQRVYL